jgi:hypothetical protein
MGKEDSPKKYIDLEKGISIKEIPSLNIYANCGSWVDKSSGWFKEVGGYGRECSYVETEEVSDRNELRIYVRVKTFPEHIILDEGFVREILV